jgi:molybdopterin-guanine dinucleotide biosynthesis protein A
LSVLSDVERLLAAGERRASLLADLPGIEMVDADELPRSESLRNLNTMEDYRSALAAGPGTSQE